MRKVIPYVLLAIATVVAYFSFFGEEGYRKLSSLRSAVDEQKYRNKVLHTEVTTLKNEVYNLQSNPREIERAARNELGMAKPGEVVIFFDKRGDSR